MNNICQECGMVCRTPTEYHPYAACLMFKACHDGDKVRANLEAVRSDARATQADAAEVGQEAAAVQAVGAVPLFWYRPCGDNLYEGPFHANSAEGKLLREEKPDAWHPLYTAAVGAWQDIATAPKGQVVLVYTPPQPGDWPDQVRIDFDCIGPDYEGWTAHSECYEHYMAVGGSGAAGPDVECVGPAQEAPYTHWMPLPAIPADSSMGGGER